jgi:hypothetical protein
MLAIFNANQNGNGHGDDSPVAIDARDDQKKNDYQN